MSTVVAVVEQPDLKHCSMALILLLQHQYLWLMALMCLFVALVGKLHEVAIAGTVVPYPSCRHKLSAVVGSIPELAKCLDLVRFQEVAVGIPVGRMKQTNDVAVVAETESLIPRVASGGFQVVVAAVVDYFQHLYEPVDCEVVQH